MNFIGISWQGIFCTLLSLSGIVRVLLVSDRCVFALRELKGAVVWERDRDKERSKGSIGDNCEEYFEQC